MYIYTYMNNIYKELVIHIKLRHLGINLLYNNEIDQIRSYHANIRRSKLISSFSPCNVVGFFSSYKLEFYLLNGYLRMQNN